MSDVPATSDMPPIDRLRQRAALGHDLLTRPDLSAGGVRMWTSSVRAPLVAIFGSAAPVVAAWPTHNTPFQADRFRETLEERLAVLERLIESVCSAAEQAVAGTGRNRVFIGHGRSPAWRELKDFLQERLRLQYDEFNRESVAGVATTERLQRMLDDATFAFLIMTAEDEHADASLHARENVVHEVGLFQGKLGMRRAIILLEEGCHVFSNIHGLTYVGFPKNRIAAAFEEIRRVLEREGVIAGQ